MQPVKIIKAKNGYIIEIAQANNANQNDHWLFGSMQEMFTTIAKHFNDQDYMNQQLEESKDESIPSNIN